MKASTRNVIIAFAAGLGLGYFIGTTTASSLSDPCTPPTSLVVKSDSINHKAILTWVDISNVPGTTYEVVVRDSLSNQVYFKEVNVTFDTLKSLPPDQTLSVSIIKKCPDNQASLLQGTFNTFDWIITEDVVHFDSSTPRRSQLCNELQNCDSIGALPGNVTTNWASATGRELYSVVVYRVGSKNELARIVLEKNFNTSSKMVFNHDSLSCEGFQTLNAPRLGFCTPVSTNLMCGSFTDGTQSIRYEINNNISGFTVRFVGGATASNYRCLIRRCNL